MTQKYQALQEAYLVVFIYQCLHITVRILNDNEKFNRKHRIANLVLNVQSDSKKILKK